MPDPLEAAAKAEAEVARCMVHIGDNGCNDGCLDCARHRVEAIAPILTAPLLAETARLTRELEEAKKQQESWSGAYFKLLDAAGISAFSSRPAELRLAELRDAEAQLARAREALQNARESLVGSGDLIWRAEQAEQVIWNALKETNK